MVMREKMVDAIVIGGGIIGMMSARELVLRGFSVALFEKNTCGAESSSAGAGILSPIYPWRHSDFVNVLNFESRPLYPPLCRELKTATGIDPEYRRLGLLMMDEYDTKAARAWLKKYRVDYRLDSRGAFFDEIAALHNPRFLRALKMHIEGLGVKIFEHQKIDAPATKNHRVDGVLVGGKTVRSDFVVICAGAWSGDFGDASTPIFPMKGQMITLGGKPDLLGHIIVSENRYIVPRSDGKILVGSTMEASGFDKNIDRKTQISLQKFAAKACDNLADLPVINHWAGLRPATENGEVVMERDRNFANLYHHTGHLTDGINTAPASAKRLVSMIEKSL